jgi:deoxycytidylate deaminase
MAANSNIVAWPEIAVGKSGKSRLRELDAVFIAAPREISKSRLIKLMQQLLPKHNVVLGIAQEEYVDGFEGQPQFRTLQLEDVLDTVAKINGHKTVPHNIHILQYAQRDLPFILNDIRFHKVLFVRGSWKYVFHNSPAYSVLAAKGQDYEFISPFVDKKEALAYEDKIDDELITWMAQYMNTDFSEREMMGLAAKAARFSYDYSFQTGAVLGKKLPAGKRYELLMGGYNRVVPFQTYAMLNGASREEHFSPSHDLNHYDTIHAEVDLILNVQVKKIDLKGTTLFINLMPCPSCARMFTKTGIEEFVYSIDHSEGYAVKMLEAAGKKVRRVVL